LIGRRAERTARATLKVPSSGSTTPGDPAPSGATLRLSPGAVKRLGAGRARFSVEAGGVVYAHRIVDLPAIRASKKNKR
jgi:hypothetical protein